MATGTGSASSTPSTATVAAGAADPDRDALLLAVKRGNRRAVHDALLRRRLDPTLIDEALRLAAEFGQAPLFEDLLSDHGPVTDASLLHAMRWALRYNNRRMAAAVLTADLGRYSIPRAEIEAFRAQEAAAPKADRIVLYLIDRLLAATA